MEQPQPNNQQPPSDWAKALSDLILDADHIVREAKTLAMKANTILESIRRQDKPKGG